jgi:hypothetical protein
MPNFTIKHVDDDGHESVESVVRVKYDVDLNQLTGFESPTGDLTYNTGHAFVMNDQGKTVAAYNFRTKK